MWPDTWARQLGGTSDHRLHGQWVDCTKPFNNPLYLPFSPFLLPLMLPTEGELPMNPSYP